MVTEVGVLTVLAVTVNVAEVAPAATVTLVGTVAAVALELDSDMLAPPLGAAAVRVTVPVPVAPLASELGLTDTVLSAAGGGVMVKLDEVTLAPEKVAVTVAEVEVVTVPAVIVNTAEVAPAATVTLIGTVAADVFELESETVTPPAPAASVNVTVPVPVVPLAIVLGLTDTPLRAPGGGVTVKLDEVLLAPE